MRKTKYSKYNIDIPFENQILLYNSISDHFLVLEPLLFDLLQAATNENNIEAIKDYHESFYEALFTNSFIVDNQYDEYAFVRSKILSTDFNVTDFNIIINPTMNCNFNCWYCYEEHIKSSKMPDSVIQSIYLLMDKVTSDSNLKNLHLGWFGGEPLLNYKNVMLPILKYANKICQQKDIVFYSDITTNGYLIKQEMIDEFKVNKLQHFQITLDGNKEKHDKVRFVNDKTGSYEKIIENVKLLTFNELHVNLRINFTMENLEGLEEIIVDLKECNADFLTVDMQQVWQTEKTDDLKLKIIDIKEKFRNNNLTVVTNTVSYIKDSCYADKLNEVVINYNGDLYKCTARDFNSENKLGFIDSEGNLVWKNDVYNSRQKAKLNNKPCQECPILPICGSGCSEYAFQNQNIDYCVYDFEINKKRELVLEHFQESLIDQKQL